MLYRRISQTNGRSERPHAQLPLVISSKCVWLTCYFAGNCRGEQFQPTAIQIKMTHNRRSDFTLRYKMSQTVSEKWRPSSVTRKLFVKRALLSSLSGFGLRSGLVCSHSLALLSFSLSRSLSLCFFDFFFLCWLMASCWWAQSEWLCGGWWLLNLVSCSLLSETCVSDVLDSLCIRGKPFCPPGKPFWFPVRLLVRWNSVFAWKLGLRVGAAASCSLFFNSPFTVGCCCNLWSWSLCLLTASLSSESKGTGRFWESRKSCLNISLKKPQKQSTASQTTCTRNLYFNWLHLYNVKVSSH